MSTEQNKLGTMPIGRLLISMSIPMMISFFIQALYNMVDSMFVARISENALTAVSIAFPLQQIITAIGVAVNALVPRYTGQGQKNKVLRIANVAVVLSFCYTIETMSITQPQKMYSSTTSMKMKNAGAWTEAIRRTRVSASLVAEMNAPKS